MRWDNLLSEVDEQARLPGYGEPAVVRRFDAPEALDTRFYEIHAKSALNKVPEASMVPFRWTINPYRGCSHGCKFCYARATHRYLEMGAGRDFEREIVVKVNVPEVLRAELRRPSWSGEHIAMGTNTDPYQWVEGRYGLMSGIWEALRDFHNPASILTRSPLVLRDLPVMKELAEHAPVSANFSVPTIDEKVWRQTEPRSPNPRARLEAMGELNRNGIPCGVLVAPLMPGINDSPRQVEKILELARENGATGVSGIGLHLRKGVKEVFMEWLHDERPDLVDRYEELYARGAYAPKREQARLAALLRGFGTTWPKDVERPGEGLPGLRDHRGVRRPGGRIAAEAAGPAARAVQSALF